MKTIIDVDTLASQLGTPDLVVLDCRFSLADEEAGQREYDAGHIPGARYVHLNRDLSAPHVPGKTGRHPLPGRDTFAATVSRLGIGNQCRVVACDDGAGAFAARLWWMLRWLGHEDVQVLSGGMNAWRAAGQPVTTDVPDFAPADFVPRPSLTRTVSAGDIPGRAGLLLDARDKARFTGETEPIDPVAGHIPGAICLPFQDNVTREGKMKSPAELRERFDAAGIDTAADVICYCGSGVTATHNILAICHAGLPEPALYPGSWSEWITDPKRPVETGDTRPPR